MKPDSPGHDSGVTAEKIFAQFLRYAGYPEDLVVWNYPIGRVTADVVVLDPATKSPLLVFEIKHWSEEPVTRESELQLAAVRRRLDPLQVSTYAVRVDTSVHGVQVYEISGRGVKLVNTDLPKLEVSDGPASTDLRSEALPTLEQASRSVQSRTIRRYVEKLSHTLDTFTAFSWLLAVVAAVFFVLDVLGVISLDARQLSLLGIVIVLVLAPFSSKLKVLGIEFERYHRTALPKKEETESDEGR
jgi:hypothetical protein